ncbi:MAG TPA: archease [Dehalococcoidales bacterium]|nr:archease [Dehalococcoidales bacterium]
MKRFELIEHTADTGLVAFGRSLPEAFANAAYGMFSIMTDLETVREAETRRVEVDADDIEELLFEWLNSLLYHFDVEGLLFKRFEVQQLSDTELIADCYGEKFDRARHEIKVGVKSATLHTLEVDKENNRVRVIFDI